MALTPEQLTALRAACFADPLAAPYFLAPGDSAGLHAYLNSTSAFIVWKTSVQLEEITQNGFDWVRVDNLSVGKARIWDWMFGGEDRSINPSKPNVRAGIEEVWKGTAADLAVRAQVYVHCKRAATVGEAKLATGTGTDVAPGFLTHIGEIIPVDATRLIYKDDGTLWTAGG